MSQPAAPQSTFLSNDELTELTGYKTPRAQARWLAAQGFPFVLNGKGRPIVLRAYVVARMGAPAEQQMETGMRTEPDWSHWEKKVGKSTP